MRLEGSSQFVSRWKTKSFFSFHVAINQQALEWVTKALVKFSHVLFEKHYCTEKNGDRNN
jgi:hypothetical protein